MFDLHRDPAEILDLSGGELVEEMKGPKALRTVYANKMPALVELGLIVNPQTEIGLPEAEIVRRAAVVSSDEQFARRVDKALEKRYPPFEPTQVVEGRIYERFPTHADKSRMLAFHAADWVGRAKIAETFEDDRYRELARRLVFVNAPEMLAEPRRLQLRAWLENRRYGREGIESGRTLPEAILDAREVIKTSGGTQEILAILNWLETHETTK